MAERDQIDGLIATYRELNSKVRPLPEERLRLKGEQGSVREVITRLRDDELRFSQSLKERTTGVGISEAFAEDGLVLGTESSDDTTATILSQFGTARESTLAMLRSLPSEGWDQGDANQPGQPGQPAQTVRTLVRRLIDNDRKHMGRIVGLLGSP